MLKFIGYRQINQWLTVAMAFFTLCYPLSDLFATTVYEKAWDHHADRPVVQLGFTPDGKSVLYPDYDTNAIKQLSMESGSEVKDLRVNPLGLGFERTFVYRCSQNCDYVAILDRGRNKVYIRNIMDTEDEWLEVKVSEQESDGASELNESENLVEQIEFSLGGNYLIVLIKMSKRKVIKVFEEGISDALVTADGTVPQEDKDDFVLADKAWKKTYSTVDSNILFPNETLDYFVCPDNFLSQANLRVSRFQGNSYVMEGRDTELDRHVNIEDVSITDNEQNETVAVLKERGNEPLLVYHLGQDNLWKKQKTRDYPVTDMGFRKVDNQWFYISRHTLEFIQGVVNGVHDIMDSFSGFFYGTGPSVTREDRYLYYLTYNHKHHTYKYACSDRFYFEVTTNDENSVPGEDPDKGILIRNIKGQFWMLGLPDGNVKLWHAVKRQWLVDDEALFKDINVKAIELSRDHQLLAVSGFYREDDGMPVIRLLRVKD